MRIEAPARWSSIILNIRRFVGGSCGIKGISFGIQFQTQGSKAKVDKAPTVSLADAIIVDPIKQSCCMLKAD
jgi:hypothetical protein